MLNPNSNQIDATKMDGSFLTDMWSILHQQPYSALFTPKVQEELVKQAIYNGVLHHSLNVMKFTVVPDNMIICTHAAIAARSFIPFNIYKEMTSLPSSRMFNSILFSGELIERAFLDIIDLLLQYLILKDETDPSVNITFYRFAPLVRETRVYLHYQPALLIVDRPTK